MEFEICKNNVTKFITEHKKCVPNSDVLKSMYSAGYTFKLNDKKMTLKQLIKEFE